MSLPLWQLQILTLYLLLVSLLLAAELLPRPRWARAAAWLALPAGAAVVAALLWLSPHGPAWSPDYEPPAASKRRPLMLALGGGGGGMLGARRGGTGNGLAGGTGQGEAGGEPAGNTDPPSSGWRDAPAALPPLALDVLRDCPDCPEMVVVPAGDAVIGAAPGDASATAAERPRQNIRFWPGFAIARFETTVAQYAQFTAATGRPEPACAAPTPLGAEAGDLARMPVTCVSAQDAGAYAAWMKQRTGKPFRLPSAAEWEYAARAGAASGAIAFPRPAASSASMIALRAAAVSTLSGPQPAGAGVPNVWGIFAMPGSVAEHVADCWHDTLHDLPPSGRAYQRSAVCFTMLLKDGAWNEPHAVRRVSARRPISGLATSPGIGFRVARDLR